MKVAILTVQVPFTTGGAELHAQSLKEQLIARGCKVDIVSVPFKWYPPQNLLRAMLMGRLLDVEEVDGAKIDRVIALKFPAYFAAHQNKVCWILHQHRQAYDLYGTDLSDLWQSEAGRAVAAEIKRWDDHFLPQSRAVYANSKTVAERLRRFNQITAEPLYHPPYRAESFKTGDWDNYILYPGRFDSIKRQHLLFQALDSIPDRIRIVLCGDHESAYGQRLVDTINKSRHRGRVSVTGHVSQEEKVQLYANCLAVYNGVLDEDYGYVTLEAFHSGKPVITHSDSGGPLEFVVHEYNGCVTDPRPEELAAAITVLAEKPSRARELGQNGRASITAQNISWDYVIERLLS